MHVSCRLSVWAVCPYIAQIGSFTLTGTTTTALNSIMVVHSEQQVDSCKETCSFSIHRILWMKDGQNRGSGENGSWCIGNMLHVFRAADTAVQPALLYWALASSVQKGGPSICQAGGPAVLPYCWLLWFLSSAAGFYFSFLPPAALQEDQF